MIFGKVVRQHLGSYGFRGLFNELIFGLGI
jgi:hypothetical protein